MFKVMVKVVKSNKVKYISPKMSSQETNSPVRLAPSPKKRRLQSASLSKWFVCQKSSEGLVTPGGIGYSTFVRVVKLRFEAGEGDLCNRLEKLLDQDSASIADSYKSEIKWYKACYTVVTSKKNLSHLKDISVTVESTNSTKDVSTRRSQVSDFDWKKCIFCQKCYHGKDKNLTNVSTFRFCQTLEHIVHQKNDEKLILHLGDFSKLIENEAVYHKGCHASYINVKEKAPPADRDNAFKQFLEQIEANLNRGRAYDMSTLLAI